MTIINVDEQEAFAAKKLPKEIYDYFASGATDELAVNRNINALKSIKIIPRVLNDMSHINTETHVLGSHLSIPAMIAPMAFQLAAHPEGEIATMHASTQCGIGMIVSAMSSTALELIAETNQAVLWFQIYVYKDRGITEKLIKRAEAAGYRAIVLTVDTPIMGKRERDIRNGFKLPTNVRAMNFVESGLEKITSDDVGSQVKNYSDNHFDRAFTWKDLDWLRSITSLPIILKGILHEKDALLALESGMDAIIISNHGGRQLDCVPAPIEVLPRINNVIQGKIPLLIDGGFRRGADIFKAMALGADVVLLGRPILWALANNGAKGVVDLLNMFTQELNDTMILAGCQSIAQIKKMSSDIVMF